jgi:hypothetical protein
LNPKETGPDAEQIVKTALQDLDRWAQWKRPRIYPTARRLRRADGPCQQVRRLWDGPHPTIGLMPSLRGPATVILTGRATTVPFTTDASGRKRTPTDNPAATMTCTVRRLAGWRPRPIWLCKQEVAGSNLAVPTTSYGCLADGTTHKRAVLPIL